MRSITGKLTLAFLIVGILGAILVAMVIRQAAHREFTQFVFGNHERIFQSELSGYYMANGNSWKDIEKHLRRGSRRQQAGENNGPVTRRFFGTLANPNGKVLFSTVRQQQSATLSAEERLRAKPIIVENHVVGLLVLTPPPDILEGELEKFFLRRFGLAVSIGAIGGAMLALIAGALLARTLTKPIHRLTAATQTLADGELGFQVNVQSDDEIGLLANSFNSMSSQLAKSNDLRQQMTADIAHDLRTPLSVILGYTEALNDGKLSGNADMFEVLHRQARHLNHLIEELRTLSLADAGKLTLYKQPVAPATLLAQIQMAHQVQADNQGVAIHIDNGSNLPQIDADPDRMIQVLGNLVNNALHHTPSGGSITLSGHAHGDYVQINVADTGSGIPAADQAAIFERFYKVDKTRSQEGTSGLGLPIAKSIVEAHGGTISVESEEGKGSTFTVSMPVRDKS